MRTAQIKVKKIGILPWYPWNGILSYKIKVEQSVIKGATERVPFGWAGELQSCQRIHPAYSACANDPSQCMCWSNMQCCTWEIEMQLRLLLLLQWWCWSFNYNLIVSNQKHRTCFKRGCVNSAKVNKNMKYNYGNVATCAMFIARREHIYWAVYGTRDQRECSQVFHVRLRGIR